MTFDIITKTIEPNTSINVYTNTNPKNIISIKLTYAEEVQKAVCQKIQEGLAMYCGVVAGVTEAPYMAGELVCDVDIFDQNGCFDNLYKTFPNNAPGWKTNCLDTCNNKIISNLQDVINNEKNKYINSVNIKTQLEKIQTTIENLIKEKYPKIFPPKQPKK